LDRDHVPDEPFDDEDPRDDDDLEALARELFGPAPLFDSPQAEDEDRLLTPGERVL
jgi:hypothetical protein